MGTTYDTLVAALRDRGYTTTLTDDYSGTYLQVDAPTITDRLPDGIQITDGKDGIDFATAGWVTVCGNPDGGPQMGHMFNLSARTIADIVDFVDRFATDPEDALTYRRDLDSAAVLSR